MSYLGQAPGLGQRSVFRFVAQAGQSVFSGRDFYNLVLAYAPGVPTLVALNGRLLSASDFTASDGSTITLGFSANAGDDLLVLSDAPFSPANTYTVDAADVKFTRKRNRILDPGMRISQENGNNLITLANGVVSYPTDSFFAARAGQTGGATVQRVAGLTPGGSLYSTRVTVTSPNPAPSASDYLAILTRIEGVDIADLRFGSATAKFVVLRFGVKVSVAGTYSFAVRNGSLDRSYIGTFTISPGEVGSQVTRSAVIPGDVVGTWRTDSGIGFDITFGLSAGSSPTGVLGWQSGQQFVTASCTNLMATNGATFELFDVGLYEGAVLPGFELGSFAEEFSKCQRYYQKTCLIDQLPNSMADEGAINWQQALTSDLSRSTWYFQTEMRGSPTVSFWAAQKGTPGYFVNYFTGSLIGGNTPLISSKNVVFQTTQAQNAGTIIGVQAVANARLG